MDALKENGSRKYFYGKDFNFLHAENNFIQYEDSKGSLILPQLNVLGEHQLENISTAIMTSRTLFNVKDDDIKKAVKDAKSGQVEIRNDKDGNIGVALGKNLFQMKI